MNWKRIIAGGLAAGALIDVAEAVLSGRSSVANFEASSRRAVWI